MNKIQKKSHNALTKQFIKFNKTDDKNLSKTFMDDLQKASPILKKIINQYKIRVSIYECELKCYMVMLSLHVDSVLIELGKKYNFPRGFPCFWIPNKIIRTYGFYPKFENDIQGCGDVYKFENVDKISFFVKWSGFLGQLIVFEFEGKQYWTVSSKNSLDSELMFVQEAKRIYEKYLTDKLINHMILNELHICSEIMSKKDQQHGSEVYFEAPVVTCIGNGKCYKFEESKDQIDVSINYLNNIDLINFCHKFDLPCGEAVTINGSEAVGKFMSEINNNRDFMTDFKFQEILNLIKEYAEIIPGTITHKDVLGDCLEGIVIKVFKKNDVDIVKYKFINYVVRTMFFRTVFESGYCLVPEIKKKITRFIERWCMNEENYNYWYRYILRGLIIYANKTEYVQDVGKHIQIANQAKIEMEKSDGKEEREFDQVIESRKKGTVIICIGPIGSGKSTFGKNLCKIIKNSVHIDGDYLIDDFDTMKLGHERNDFTQYQVIEALMDEKIPILSTGGGAICSNKGDFLLMTKIHETLHIDCKFIICVSGAVDDVEYRDEYDMTDFYNNFDVKNIVKKRVSNKDWNIPKNINLEGFCNKIKKASDGNAEFAKLLVKNGCYVFPYITSENYNHVHKYNFNQIISNINPIDSINPIIIGKFSQIRILVWTNCIGHITWMYDANQNISFSIKDFDDLLKMYPPTVNGTIITVKSKCLKHEYSFVVPDKSIHEDNSTHITINSGKHAPKETKILALNQTNDSVSIPLKSGQFISYDMTKANKTQITFRVLGVFGI